MDFEKNEAVFVHLLDTLNNLSRIVREEKEMVAISKNAKLDSDSPTYTACRFALVYLNWCKVNEFTRLQMWVDQLEELERPVAPPKPKPEPKPKKIKAKPKPKAKAKKVK